MHIAKMEGESIFDEDVDRRSGNLLRAWREHRGMTQEQLASAVNTTGSVISLLEAGDRKLSPKWLYRLAPALDTTPGYLLDHHPEDLPDDIIETWSSIPQAQRKHAREVLQTFRHRTGTED
ncbi:helix-turn-helix transcriptional regulator [Sphingosinithalassobacter tenebrarum]|uniref:Helix-turn-helix transcriptional regulator n=2 Tax=Stakelama tenebrarum TaxID=2711215 RepID=A0A6G6Y4T5_9SPHN|nr:helix-turn-helix transcriptional regulator [Sphingosinithalassobacter tenebrarum]